MSEEFITITTLILTFITTLSTAVIAICTIKGINIFRNKIALNAVDISFCSDDIEITHSDISHPTVYLSFLIINKGYSEVQICSIQINNEKADYPKLPVSIPPAKCEKFTIPIGKQMELLNKYKDEDLIIFAVVDALGNTTQNSLKFKMIKDKISISAQLNNNNDINNVNHILSCDSQNEDSNCIDTVDRDNLFLSCDDSHNDEKTPENMYQNSPN